MKKLLLITTIALTALLSGCGSSEKTATGILDKYLRSWAFGSPPQTIEYNGKYYEVENRCKAYSLEGFNIKMKEETLKGIYAFKINYEFKTRGGSVRTIPGGALVYLDSKIILISVQP